MAIAFSNFFAFIAALIHVYIFVLESFRWKHPDVRKIFGTTEEQALLCESMAFNQGFYNLFLSLAIFLGLMVHSIVLVNYAMLSILGASLVLLYSKPKMKRAVIIQGGPVLFYFLFRILFS